MYVPRRILVPTDFSRHAEEALEHAVTLGARHQAEITLLHVDEFIVSPLASLETPSEAVQAYREEKREYINRNFRSMERICDARNISLRTVVKEGRAYRVIVEEGEREDYDLIVLSTRGQTHLSQNLIGSTSERVVRLSRQPVLSVQQGPHLGGAIRSVLCPTDLSPAGNVAISYALSFARQSSAVLYLQYVSELEKPEPIDAIRKRLPDLKDHHPAADSVKVEYVFDRDIEASNSIIRFAEDRDVSLIVMSTHGKKGLRRVYIGNNTAEVVRQSRRPVLTVMHPFHKRVFARPATERTDVPFD
jgi:nucleotide-binding universal stress UspA family protein